MGPATVGQVEAGDLEAVAAVTQLDAPTSTNTAPSGPGAFYLSASPLRSESSPMSQPTALFARLRSIMSSWRSEKKKHQSATKAEYTPVARDDEEDRADDTGDGSTGMSHHKRRRKCSRSRCMFGVASLSVALLVADIGGKIARNLVPGRRPDPFGNWGKPGTGTENLAWYPTDFLRDVIPVPCHSHNDYWRKVPLFSALYAGCTGVEADVWLRDGDLLVGHDTASLQPNRTFQTLYVNPLVEILTRQNPQPESPGSTAPANGVFDTDPQQTLVLLVDLKTDGPTTWPWVMEQLSPLRDRGWLSYYEDGHFHQRPITVVGTGNTPFEQIVGGGDASNSRRRRDAFFDAPLDKLENSPFNWTNSYYASVSFWKAVGAVWWRGGPGEAQLATIRAHLREARERGLVSRYWALPAWPIHVRNRVWQLLVEEGIGMLNVDDLEAATQQDWTKPGTF